MLSFRESTMSIFRSFCPAIESPIGSPIGSSTEPPIQRSILLVFWKLNFWLRKYFKILCNQNILEIVKTLKERSPSESIYYISSDPVFSFQSEINIEFNTFRLKTSVIMNIKFISWGPYGNTKVNFIMCYKC